MRSAPIIVPRRCDHSRHVLTAITVSRGGDGAGGRALIECASWMTASRGEEHNLKENSEERQGLSRAGVLRK